MRFKKRVLKNVIYYTIKITLFVFRLFPYKIGVVAGGYIG